MSTTANINVIHLVGRAGIDPEIRFFEGGAKLTKLNVAVKRGKNEQPSWFSLQFWGRLAEICGDYVHKGDLLEIVGELKLEEWTDSQTGVKRSKPVVNVDKLEMLGGSRSSSTESEPEDQF